MSKFSRFFSLVLSGNLIAVSIVLIAIGSTYGAIKFYTDNREKMAAAEKQREENERIKQFIVKSAQAEKQRIASLTPAQLAAEEKQKREKAKVDEKEAAEKAAQIEAEKTKVEAEKARTLSDKDKHNTQMALAALGAAQLKDAAKDPDTFQLKSLYLTPDGTACYTYRAKNSFNAHLKGEAVLTTKGKMLIAEHDGNSFANAWNKSCTDSGGEEIAYLVKMSGVYTDGSDK